MTKRQTIFAIIMLIIGIVAVTALLLAILAHQGFFERTRTTNRESSIIRNIPTEFTLYEGPSFDYAIIGTEQPRLLFIFDDNGDGWVEVSFNGNFSNGWAFLPPLPTINLPRPMGVFESPEHDGSMMDYLWLIGPGDFEYVQRQGNWYLLNTLDGVFWTDLAFWPSVSILEDFFSALPYNVSVFYQNLDTDFSFGHRDEIRYFTASLNKATHAFYVYHLAEEGIANLNHTHIFRSGERRWGTGVIWRRGTPYGTIFTHLELLRYSVLYSDNSAFAMLNNIYADFTPSYLEFYRSIGGDVSLVPSINGHMMTAAEAAHIMRRIHEYFETGTEYALHFQYSMLNSDVPKIISRYPTAQKYGGWRPAFHDMAIVYAPSPYILTILTNLYNPANQPFGLFEEISLFIQDFNDRYFRTIP
ncbi:MAG: class A beta-lactamase-related serine hydrolase [Defluviitaleaceae bacterium]|nr:class A beta-lactamase-related serine hydrolase [Defluviitaleaceae bacterium]